LRPCSEDYEVFVTTVYHLMPKNKCLVLDIIICGGSCGGHTHAVNCQSVVSMSQGITACDFGEKAISFATFMKTKESA
jgi:hypothetical protein